MECFTPGHEGGCRNAQVACVDRLSAGVMASVVVVVGEVFIVVWVVFIAVVVVKVVVIVVVGVAIVVVGEDIVVVIVGEGVVVEGEVVVASGGSVVEPPDHLLVLHHLQAERLHVQALLVLPCETTSASLKRILIIINIAQSSLMLFP